MCSEAQGGAWIGLWDGSLNEAAGGGRHLWTMGSKGKYKFTAADCHRDVKVLAALIWTTKASHIPSGRPRDTVPEQKRALGL